MIEYDKFEHPCDDCIHRFYGYCRDNKRPIKYYDVRYCKKRKLKE